VELVERPRSDTADAPPAKAPLAVKLLVSAGPLFEASDWIAPCTVLMPRLAISSAVSTVTGEAILSALDRNSVPVTTISLVASAASSAAGAAAAGAAAVWACAGAARPIMATPSTAEPSTVPVR